MGALWCLQRDVFTRSGRLLLVMSLLVVVLSFGWVIWFRWPVVGAGLVVSVGAAGALPGCQVAAAPFLAARLARSR